jgi:Tol biopolymer transport system component
MSAIGLHRERGFGFFTVSLKDGRVTPSSITPGFPLASRPVAAEGSRVRRFQWNAAGDALFVDAVVNQVRNLWKIRVDPRTLAWVSAEALTTGIGADVGAALSSDGTRLVFTTQRESVRLWEFPFDAAAGRVVTGKGRPVSQEEGIVTEPDLSPDGRTVAYVLRRGGSSRADLWVTHIDSGKRDLLAQNVYGPCWSRDGNTIAYNLFRPDRPSPGEWALAFREWPGVERVLGRWSTKSVFLATDWTRDGRAILGTYLAPPITGRAKVALWPKWNTTATAPERVLVQDAAANLWNGRFSPDGRWVSFTAQSTAERARSRLFLVPAGGGTREEWTAVAGEHEWTDKPRWAPDGRTIYFLSRHNSPFFNLWASRFDREHGKPVGEPFQLTNFDSPSLLIWPEIAGAANGISANRAVLTMATVTGNIWMIENVDR